MCLRWANKQPSRHTKLKWCRINVDATWSRRIDVDTTSLWCYVPAGSLVVPGLICAGSRFVCSRSPVFAFINVLKRTIDLDIGELPRISKGLVWSLNVMKSWTQMRYNGFVAAIDRWASINNAIIERIHAIHLPVLWFLLHENMCSVTLNIFPVYDPPSLLILQSTLVISPSLIPNNRLSRSGNLVPVLTQRSTNRQQNIVEKRSTFSSFSQYFQYISNLGVKLHIHSVKGGFSINCSAKLICQSTDISKCFIEALGFRDNETRLYFIIIFFNSKYKNIAELKDFLFCADFKL